MREFMARKRAGAKAKKEEAERGLVLSEEVGLPVACEKEIEPGIVFHESVWGKLAARDKQGLIMYSFRCRLCHKLWGASAFTLDKCPYCGKDGCNDLITDGPELAKEAK